MVHEFGASDHPTASGIQFHADALNSREAMGIVERLRSFRRSGSPGRWELGRGEVFQEVFIKVEEGRVAIIPIGKSKGIPEGQHVANARFIIDMGNHAEWILKAAHYALKHGFKP